MTLLYSSSQFLDHQTWGHPESPARLVAVTCHLAATELDRKCRRPLWKSASVKRLARIHSSKYIEKVRHFAAGGGGHIEADTVMSEESFETASFAAGAVCDAVERTVAGEDRQAVCLVRPPGHHALRHAAMGFCLFNNVAVAASVATEELDVDRVLIVDWDVHHGNGTQASFWEDPRVGFLSVHRWPFYPGTGRADETGGGRGRGTVRNLPVEMGISRKDYLQLFMRDLSDFAAVIKPELVLVSAGFDSHSADPVGSLGLETEDFVDLTAAVCQIAATYAGGRVVSVLEGGYNPPILAECVEAHIRELLRQRKPVTE
jgi:acetoin utilization deacetylase AcuC-like enzyme